MKILIAYPPLKGKGSPMLTQNRQFQWYSEPSYIYPVVSASAATLLRQNGHEVVWCDAIAEGMGYEDFLELVQIEKPDLIAIETKTPVIKQHWKIINDLHERRTTNNARLILMGDHVTAFPEESLENCAVDYVIVGGDYDFALLEIVSNLMSSSGGEKFPGTQNFLQPKAKKQCRDYVQREKILLGSDFCSLRSAGLSPQKSLNAPEISPRRRCSSKIFRCADMSPNPELDSLPFINRTLTKAQLYGEKWKRRTPFFYTMAGRDCWWNKCSFCNWRQLYPRFKVMSAQRLLDEIGFLIERHNAQEIFDDTGTFPTGEWLYEFCEGMIKRGYNKKIFFSCNMRFGVLDRESARLMKQAGFRKLKMGLESANQGTLDRLEKGIDISKVPSECRTISKEGLGIQLTVMVGYPWESKRDARRSLEMCGDLMKRGYAEMLQATVIVPYPGTALYNQALENNWFSIDPKDYEKYDMSQPVFKSSDMEPKEVMRMCRSIYKTFLSPQYIMRNFLRMRSFRDLGYLARGAKAVLGHIRDFKQ